MVITKRQSKDGLYWGIIVFFIFEYLRPSYYFPPIKILHLNSIIPIALLILTFFSDKGTPSADIIKNANTKRFLVYLFLFLISVFTARLTFNAYIVFKGLLGYIFLTYVLLKNIDDLEKMKGIFICLIFIHLFILLINPQVLNPHTRRFVKAGSFLGDGNDFALSICITIPMCFYLFQTAKRRITKISYGAIGVIFVFSTIATQSRGGSLALGAVLLYLFFESKRKVLGMAILSVGILTLLYFGSSTYFERMSSIKDYQTESSAHQRINAWKAGFRMALDHPFTGIGAGGFASAYGALYRPPEYAGFRGGLKWSNAHSIYFQLLGEAGFPALILLLIFIIKNIILNRSIAKQIIQNRRNDQNISANIFITLNAMIVAFAVGGAFLTAIYYPHFFVIFSLCATSQIIFFKLDYQDK